MIRQYGASRFHNTHPIQCVHVDRRRKTVTYQPHPGNRRVGTIPVGSIFYIQDGLRPFGGEFRHRSPVFRDPWIVMAWLNREYFPAVQGQPPVKFMAAGHLALVKSLRTGRVQRVSDWILLRCRDEGWERT